MKAEPVSRLPKLAAMVTAFERVSGASITIHDVRGILSTQESSRILPGRFLHNDQFCKRGRFERTAWNNLCTNDCKKAVYEQLKRDSSPFVKLCWKGVLELVVPVVREGRMMLVLYAGVFRRCGRNEPEKLGELHAEARFKRVSLPSIVKSRSRQPLSSNEI